MGHVYSVDEVDMSHSVTGIVSSLFGRFYPRSTAARIVNSPKYAEGPYAGMSAEEIVEAWSLKGRLAAERGSKLHFNIHLHLNGFHVQDDSPEFKLYLQWLHQHHDWTLLRSEMAIASVKLGMVAGSVDALFMDREGHIILVDWKCSSKDFESGKGWGKGAVAHLPDCPLSRYWVQCNLYMHILRVEYNAVVDKAVVVQFDFEKDLYIEHDVLFLGKEAMAILNDP